jgi:hypothetical protein
MKAKEFDEKFGRDEGVTRFLDRDHARRPGLEQKRVNVDFPVQSPAALRAFLDRGGLHPLQQALVCQLRNPDGKKMSPMKGEALPAVKVKVPTEICSYVD